VPPREHLKSVADDIKSNGTLEDIRKAMFSKAKGQLTSAEILPNSRYHKDGAKIVRELIKKGSISEDAYYSLVGRNTGNTHTTSIPERLPFSRQ
jgi:hypothetical protein